MKRIKLRSLAKINLDLRVLHKSPDGFHELRTVFQTISLADTIEIEYEPARRTELSIDGNVDIPDNLILRAAQAVLDAMRVHARVRFRLTKRIPMGGGLGGGSSNAAAVLLALPVLARCKVSVEEIAAELGSDVPFFLTGGTAVGVGRGTELYSLPDIARSRFWWSRRAFMWPPGRLTQALDRSLTFTGSSSSINSFQAFVRALGERATRAGGECAQRERFRSGRFPAVSPAQNDSQASCRNTSGLGGENDGSGSAIFAIFESVAERERARNVLEGDRVFHGCRMIDGETGEPAQLSSAVAAAVCASI